MAEITLLIPCYNAAEFLPRLLESVGALSSPFSKILCYDDGSGDETVAVARQFGLEIIAGNMHRGVAHARNQLAAAARTEWIHFNDADDPIAPTFVARLGPYCDDRHDVISCDADWVDEISRALVIAWRYDAAELLGDAQRYLLGHPMSLSNSIIRRSAWLSIRGCDETLTMWEDADVHFRLAGSGARFHHVPEVLTISLRRRDSFSHDYRKSWTCRVDALERYAATPLTPALSAVLAAQAEKAAGELALLDMRPAAERAIALCRRLGVRPPSSRHPLLRALRNFLPTYQLVRWQARHRQRPTVHTQ